MIYAVERVLSTMQSLPAAPLPTLPPLNKQHSDASPPRTVLDSRSTAPQASVCTHRSLHADAEYLPSTQWCSSPPDSVHDGLPRHTPTAVVHTAVDNTVGMLIRRLLKVALFRACSPSVKGTNVCCVQTCWCWPTKHLQTRRNSLIQWTILQASQLHLCYRKQHENQPHSSHPWLHRTAV